MDQDHQGGWAPIENCCRGRKEARLMILVRLCYKEKETASFVVARKMRETREAAREEGKALHITFIISCALGFGQRNSDCPLLRLSMSSLLFLQSAAAKPSDGLRNGTCTTSMGWFEMMSPENRRTSMGMLMGMWLLETVICHPANH